MNAIKYIADEVRRVEEKIRTQMALVQPHISQVQELLEYEKSLVEAQLALVRQRIELQQAEVKRLSELATLGAETAVDETNKGEGDAAPAGL